jgi:hypothetical protein
MEYEITKPHNSCAILLFNSEKANTKKKAEGLLQEERVG